LSKHEPFNTIALRQQIAQKTIEAGIPAGVERRVITEREIALLKAILLLVLPIEACGAALIRGFVGFSAACEAASCLTL